VAGPLGIDCHIGLAAEHDARVAEFIPLPPGEPDFEAELLKKAGPMTVKAVNNPPHTVADMNTLAWRRAEIPAGNAHTNARALARVYGALASAGEVDGVRVLSPESIERARAEQANGPDAVLFGWPTRFGLGFSLPPEGAGFGSSGTTAFGCPGGGGSIGFAARPPRATHDRRAVCIAVNVPAGGIRARRRRALRSRGHRAGGSDRALPTSGRRRGVRAQAATG
jgi:CubicO group peptidase (beta-lactamase class C family)